VSQISLEFLTTDEHIRRLCEDYWEIASDGKFVWAARSVAESFGVKQHLIIPLVNKSCIARMLGDTCPRCNESPTFLTRTELTQYQSAQRNGWSRACHSCNQKALGLARSEQAAAHKLRTEQQAALAAQKVAAEALERENRAAQAQRRRQSVVTTFADASRERKPADPMGFSLKHAVWFLSLVRLGASEDLSFVAPFASLGEPLSGDPEQDTEILKSLYKCRFIYVDPESPLDTFRFEEDKVDIFYVNKVQWVLSDEKNADYARFVIQDLESTFRKKRWASRWHDEVTQLWKDVALQDCLDFLRAQLEEHDFEFKPGEKTMLVLRGALEEYSPGQVFSMIWRAVRDAASFFTKGGVTRQHAGNIVPGAIQRNAESARAHGRVLNPFQRSSKFPQPMISQVFFDVVLQIGANGMSTIPGDMPLSDITSDEDE
jgi:hypothetical protein